MGKRIISQRRGRGTTTYRTHSFRWKTRVQHRKYDQIERESIIRGRVRDLRHNKGLLAPIAVIKYEDNKLSNIFAPDGMRVGDEVQSGPRSEIKPGNTLPLKSIPEGTFIYNIEIKPGDGGKLCRAPGMTSKLISNLNDVVLVELPSKKQKKLSILCRATIGMVTGIGRKDKPIVKAGKRHHMMRARGKLYPLTSGVAMNAVDHPFGSGRGRQHAKIKPPSRFAPPGRKVGPIGARRTGRKKGVRKV